MRWLTHYIILWNFTDEGLKSVRESPKRAENFKSMAEKAGCELIGTYYTMGLYVKITATNVAKNKTAYLKKDVRRNMNINVEDMNASINANQLA